VLLTISTTHVPATDLGHLLHKHPDRVQAFTQSFGTATVLYPEAGEERCTAALLLEVDSVELARRRSRGTPDFALAQHVNDRSYAASSLLAVALADVFSTARAGICRSRQELADGPLPLEVEIPVLPCRGGPQVAHDLFAPLSWEVEATPLPLDERFPAWGDSRYVHLRLRGDVRLADALNQLYVLLPVLDESKHYWQGPDEVDKLLRAGGDWLATHPARELVTRRYLGRAAPYARVALARLAELDDRPDDTVGAPEADVAVRRPLRVARRDAVLEVLREVEAHSVVDTMGERQSDRLSLLQGALTYEDERLAGHDAAVLMEVVEHVDPTRLPALEHVVFGAARPGTVVVTTPNVEHNVLYPDLTGLRHPDHRFEWTRAEFAAWCERVCAAHGYTVEHRPVGPVDAEHGPATQMGVFRRG